MTSRYGIAFRSIASLCGPPVASPHQGPVFHITLWGDSMSSRKGEVMQNFIVLFVVCVNKLLNKPLVWDAMTLISADTIRNDNVSITSKRHYNVVLTLWRSYYYVLCPLWSAAIVVAPQKIQFSCVCFFIRLWNFMVILSVHSGFTWLNCQNSLRLFHWHGANHMIPRCHWSDPEVYGWIPPLRKHNQARQTTNRVYGDEDALYTMMTSSNGNIFRVTGPLYGKLIGHQWIPLTKASDDVLFWSAPEQAVEWTIKMPAIWDAIALIMTSL